MGNEKKIRRVEKDLFDIGFAPKVFKRSKTRRSKALDITLATYMLGHAYRDNYDVAFRESVFSEGPYGPGPMQEFLCRVVKVAPNIHKTTIIPTRILALRRLGSQDQGYGAD